MRETRGRPAPDRLTGPWWPAAGAAAPAAVLALWCLLADAYDAWRHREYPVCDVDVCTTDDPGWFTRKPYALWLVAFAAAATAGLAVRAARAVRAEAAAEAARRREAEGVSVLGHPREGRVRNDGPGALRDLRLIWRGDVRPLTDVLAPGCELRLPLPDDATVRFTDSAGRIWRVDVATGTVREA